MKKILLVLLLLSSDLRAANCTNSDFDAINKYLGNIKTMQAAFVQTNNDGKIYHGFLQVKKGVGIRLEYIKPKHVSVLVDKSSILHYDYELDEYTQLPIELYTNALNLLMKDKVDLLRDSEVQKCVASGTSFSVVASGKGNKTQPILISFKRNPLQLAQIANLDELYNVEGETDFSDHSYNISLDDSIFTFKNPKTLKARTSEDDR